ncbi:MAG: hypothetical protein NW215_02200 [Hyphomicrobiales bacterium]|nr:hypothetical protein [Hyphomicrobiales bacterium]
MRFTPPTSTTFFLSLLLAILGFVMAFWPKLAGAVPLDKFYVLVIAYAILLAGTVVKGI